MPSEIPRFRETRRGALSLAWPQVRGDSFLRFTADEAIWIAQAEAAQGCTPPSPALSIPARPTHGDDEVRTIVRRQFDLYAGGRLVWEQEYDDDDPSVSPEARGLEFLLEVLLGRETDGIEDDEEENDEEDW